MTTNFKVSSLQMLPWAHQKTKTAKSIKQHSSRQAVCCLQEKCHQKKLYSIITPKLLFNRCQSIQIATMTLLTWHLITLITQHICHPCRCMDLIIHMGIQFHQTTTTLKFTREEWWDKKILESKWWIIPWAVWSLSVVSPHTHVKGHVAIKISEAWIIWVCHQ